MSTLEKREFSPKDVLALSFVFAMGFCPGIFGLSRRRAATQYHLVACWYFFCLALAGETESAREHIRSQAGMKQVATL
jgi:hypothetical protein